MWCRWASSGAHAASGGAARRGRSMAHRWMVALALIVIGVIGLWAPDVMAAGAPGTEVGDMGEGRNVAIMLENMLNGLTAAFTPDISAAIGRTIVMSFVTMAIVWGGVQIVGGMDFVEAVVRLVKLVALAAVAMATFEPVPWLGGMSLGAAVQKMFMDAAGLEKALGNPAVAIAGKFLEVIFKMLDFNIMPPTLTGTWDKIDWIVSNPVHAIVGTLEVFGSVIAMGVAAALVVGEVFMADITMKLAIALAPVLAPWIMFAPTSFLFDAWLKTLLASGMAYFVASLVAKGADGFTAAAAAAVAGLSGATYSITSVMAVFGGLFLVSLIFVFVAGKVTDLAARLIAGGVLSGVSIQAFRQGVGALAATASSPGRAAGAAGRAAGGAGRAAALAAKLGAAGYYGAKGGAAGFSRGIGVGGKVGGAARGAFAAGGKGMKFDIGGAREAAKWAGGQSRPAKAGETKPSGAFSNLK